MKHNIFKIATLAVAMTFGLSSCHDDPGIKPGTEKGTGSVQLTSMSIDMSDAEKVIKTGAGSRATVDLNDFIVTITDKNSESFVRTYRYADMPEILTLPAGDSYVVEVESHAIAKAEWDRPYYKGSKEFSVTENEITQIGTVTARFSSLKVTIVFADDLRAVLGDDVTVTVRSNDSGELVYTPDETRAGYFEVVENSTTMVAHFEGTVDGVKTVSATPFTNIQAGQHHIVTYSLKGGPTPPEQSGNIDPSGGIGIDTDIDVEDLSGNVNVDEDTLPDDDRPGKENPDDNNDDDNKGDGGDNQGGGEDQQPAATFESYQSPNLSLTGVNTARDGFGNAIVLIGCPKGIAHLVVKIDTDNKEFEDILGEFNLPLTFDLAYPGDAGPALGSLGLSTGDEVIGHTEVQFNITDFVPLLVPYKGNHTFTITVTDTANIAETMSLRFKSE